MAITPLYELLIKNNNGINTNKFREYIRDNFEEVKASCSVVQVKGNISSRYKSRSHSMWLELGVDPRHCLICDFINGINGATDLNLIYQVYIPDGGYIDTLARKVNR